MIRIVTESMSDFTQEEAKAADLIVMPLPIRFGVEEYWDDGVSLTQDDFMRACGLPRNCPRPARCRWNITASASTVCWRIRRTKCW